MARPREFEQTAALDFAVRTFWAQGFEATSVQDLCAAMNLNPGSLYGSFGDKRALFLASLDRYMDTVVHKALECIATEPSGIAGIRVFFNRLIRSAPIFKRRRGCLITSTAAELAPRDPEVAAKVRQHLDRVEAAFAGALSRAKAAGELREGIGANNAGFLLCLLQGLNVLLKTRPRQIELQRIVNNALRGLVAP